MYNTILLTLGIRKYTFINKKSIQKQKKSKIEMSTISPTKKGKHQASQNIKSPSIENDKLIQHEQQRLIRNQQKIVQLQERVNKLKQQRAAKIYQLDSVQTQIKECKEHRQLLPLIKQLRQHYKKLKQQLGPQSYYQQDQIDVDQMSYQQLLQLGQKIGKVSKGLTEQQFAKLQKITSCCSDKCLICQQNIDVGSQCIKLKCGHVYDVDCLKEWFKMEKVCPLCKSQSI